MREDTAYSEESGRKFGSIDPGGNFVRTTVKLLSAHDLR